MTSINIEREIKITSSNDTVAKLISGGYYLYGFKAVKSSGSAGRPLILFKNQSYSEQTYVTLSVKYKAYTSSSVIAPNGQIRIGFAIDIAIGQTLQVGPGGQGLVVGGGRSTTISILNTTTTQFTCGISAKHNDAFSPNCAFPLYGEHLQTIVPVEKVLLFFSTRVLNAGTVIGNNVAFTNVLASNGPGILVDVAEDAKRDVSYDINHGWSWGGYSWAQRVAASQDLVPLLIEPE